MDIGEKLRQLRQLKNLTQEELADRCELSKGFISQVERNLASPSIATLTDMLECLGSNWKEFFSELSKEVSQGQRTSRDCSRLQTGGHCFWMR